MCVSPTTCVNDIAQERFAPEASNLAGTLRSVGQSQGQIFSSYVGKGGN